ncbi:hypothetical protein [uncultured Muribaculum sp.]|nr:hypothetical protein [uncultured Muribaculum sp.]
MHWPEAIHVSNPDVGERLCAKSSLGYGGYHKGMYLVEVLCE